jgi:hypothetical protein
LRFPKIVVHLLHFIAKRSTRRNVEAKTPPRRFVPVKIAANRSSRFRRFSDYTLNQIKSHSKFSPKQAKTKKIALFL